MSCGASLTCLHVGSDNSMSGSATQQRSSCYQIRIWITSGHDPNPIQRHPFAVVLSKLSTSCEGPSPHITPPTKKSHVRLPRVGAAMVLGFSMNEGTSRILGFVTSRTLASNLVTSKHTTTGGDRLSIYLICGVPPPSLLPPPPPPLLIHLPSRFDVASDRALLRHGLSARIVLAGTLSLSPPNVVLRISLETEAEGGFVCSSACCL